jgi:hypothetical protein
LETATDARCPHCGLTASCCLDSCGGANPLSVERMILFDGLPAELRELVTHAHISDNDLRAIIGVGRLHGWHGAREVLECYFKKEIDASKQTC